MTADDPSSASQTHLKPPIDVDQRLASMQAPGRRRYGHPQHAAVGKRQLAQRGRQRRRSRYHPSRSNAAGSRTGKRGVGLGKGGARNSLDVRRLAAQAPEIEEQDALTSAPLILTSREFVEGFEPPDYLIDGLMQRRFIYSMTGPTGTGKTAVAMLIALHVALGRPLGDREIEQGKVLFFAGENPDDVRMRWIKLCEESGIDPDSANVFWRAAASSCPTRSCAAGSWSRQRHMGPRAVIIDTSAAFFDGDDENSNTQLGNHARTMRSYVDVAGGPTILVTCHPIKNPNMENLLPRGGGAFLAEVDGNLVCIKQPDSFVVELHWHGKLRGPDSHPSRSRADAGNDRAAAGQQGPRDHHGHGAPDLRPGAERGRNSARSDQDDLMAAMRSHPEASLRELARAAGWVNSAGKPNQSKANRG